MLKFVNSTKSFKDFSEGVAKTCSKQTRKIRKPLNKLRSEPGLRKVS